MNKGGGIFSSGKLLTALLSIVLCVTSCADVYAASAEQQHKAKELAQLRKKISALRDEMNKTKSLHDSVSAELRQLERDIGKRVSALKKIKHQLRQSSRKLQKLKSQQQQYQKDLATQQVLLSQQVRTAYAMGRQAFLKLLLNQENPAAVGRTMTYYNFFNRARSQRIEVARQTIDRLDKVKRDIQQEQDRLNQLLSSQQQEKAALERTSGARAVVVVRLNKELQSKGETLARWLENEKQLQRVVEAIHRAMPEVLTSQGDGPSFRAQRGHLSWPTRGRLKALFGKPREAGQVRWNGVLIAAREGSEVRAISHGRVAYADWLRGYGLLMIIDHGNGYMSLYGHNQSLFKETGDWVEAGEVIGSVGKSGGQDQAALYFEIRHNGKPRNPTKWCKG